MAKDCFGYILLETFKVSFAIFCLFSITYLIFTFEQNILNDV